MKNKKDEKAKTGKSAGSEASRSGSEELAVDKEEKRAARGNGEAKERRDAGGSGPSRKGEDKASGGGAAGEDRLLRLQADFENFRKRTLREKGEISSRANEALLMDLLPVLDHFELAFEAAQRHEKESHAFLEGFRLVWDQLKAVLARFGLEEIDARGKEFDPNLHEAVSRTESDTAEEDFVATQVRKGYLLNGRLLRPAQVVVSVGPGDGEGVGEKQEG
ncbi:MAG: nucleotide exchange factor GrpE [Kiritimatiellia bacterium]